jgi:peptide deformylase
MPKSLSMEVVVPDEFKYLYEESKERPVVKIPAPVLRQVAPEVTKVSKQTQLLIDKMLRIMNKAHGIGLAANQVGVLQRVVIIATQGMKPTPMINPKIVRREGEQIREEGCLSIPGLYGDVKRASFVELEAMDRKGRWYSWELEGMAAQVAQHEVDHLDGVLFLDKVDLATLHWNHPEHELAKAE